MPDPLTLECSCDANVSLCNLTQLIWHVTLVYTNNIIGAIGHVLLDSGVAGGATPDASISSPGSVSYAFDLVPMANWGNPTGYFTIDNSLWQVAAGAWVSIGANDYIEQKYQCVNIVTGSTTTKSVNASSTGNTSNNCMTGPGDTRSSCTGLSGILFKSTPLGACNGCGSTAFDYEPAPVYDVTIDVENSGPICLCATGGSGDYSYSISSGSLPCGMQLHADTGCIDGTPDGTCDGVSPVVFRVTDAGGGGSGSSGGGTIGGTCGTVGPAVTRISGGNFTTDMLGRIISIAGFAYNITAVADSDHLSVSPNAGIQPNVPWSYTAPSGPAGTPTEPQFAEATCGFIFGCPTSSLFEGNFTF